MNIQLVNSELLKSAYEDKFKNMLIIDIREPAEYMREHIPGSRNIPLSKLKGIDFHVDKDKAVLVHCQLGRRTLSAQEALLATGIKEIYCLEGGIEQWKQCGLPTEVNKNAPIDVMRQVQITAGLLVLLGVILAYTLSSYFILLSALVGLGLVLAGFTGYCGMARLLMRMPWNRHAPLPSCSHDRDNP